MNLLLQRLRKAGRLMPEAEEAADLIEQLCDEVERGRLASQAMHCLTQAAQTRGYDTIHSAIASAPVRSAGHAAW